MIYILLLLSDRKRKNTIIKILLLLFPNILFSINKYYQTNYLSLEDFLAQNNFSTLADLQLYTEEFASTPKEGRG